MLPDKDKIFSSLHIPVNVLKLPLENKPQKFYFKYITLLESTAYGQSTVNVITTQGINKIHCVLHSVTLS